MTELFEFSPEELVAIRLSLRVAFWAMVGSLPFGVAVALTLARGRFWGKSLLNMVVHLPLVMPPVVTGYLLLLLLGRRGPLGRLLDEAFGIVLAFRWTGAALAGAVMGFPLLVRSIRLSVEAVDRRLEQAAATLGASAIWVFLTVTLPLIRPVRSCCCYRRYRCCSWGRNGARRSRFHSFAISARGSPRRCAPEDVRSSPGSPNFSRQLPASAFRIRPRKKLSSRQSSTGRLSSANPMLRGSPGIAA